MRHPLRAPLFGAYVAGCATVATATVTINDGNARVVTQGVQIVLGVLMVFLVPGFSFVCAALPERLSSGERLLATVGLSLAVATSASMLLAAIPVGLSRESLGVLLGGFTMVLSICGLYRARSTTALQKPEGPSSGRTLGRLGRKSAVKP